jgi:hypothetical protein
MQARIAHIQGSAHAALSVFVSSYRMTIHHSNPLSFQQTNCFLSYVRKLDRTNQTVLSEVPQIFQFLGIISGRMVCQTSGVSVVFFASVCVDYPCRLTDCAL